MIEKSFYVGLVEGIVSEDSGEITAPIGRNDEERKWKVDENGKPSHTRFRVIERFSDTTLLELEPVTGRTNQLRIHCAHIGHNIVGDEMHTEKKAERLFLHALKLNFRHPNNGREIKLETEIPEGFKS